MLLSLWVQLDEDDAGAAVMSAALVEHVLTRFFGAAMTASRRRAEVAEAWASQMLGLVSAHSS